MTRRKGEHPVKKSLVKLTDSSPVMRMLADGDHWFYAWVASSCTPWPRLSKITGIPIGRLSAISSGDYVSRAEIDAFSRAWSVSATDLIGTLPDESLVVD
ncbi:hypothetical protein [uncultured Sphingorhabdus sp.]|uniref:hypothetical protein n=1 Tax=uncultured Sphingorhabdus sp. TaxID=1686106 RepID=UPI0026263F51|nr:hypothetical protein [uncultured Sphingorhabdus sp.]HMS20039.1 hypothetical protein [Sphingorhabdus sp.]